MINMAEILANAVHDAVRIIQGSTVQYHGELLTSVAPNHIALAYALPNHLGQALNDPVSNRMAVLVVDFLEVINIEHGKRDRSIVSFRKKDRLRQVLFYTRMIQQPGECVLNH